MLMPLPEGSVEARFIQRSKRFLVEVEREGERFWVHTNNSGSMMGLLREGNPVMISPATNPNRKLRFTLELVQSRGVWVGVNTLTPNRMLQAAFRAGRLPWAGGYSDFRREAKTGDSRLDACMTGEKLPTLWVENKNVTMVEDGGVACFPDAVTERGQKHLRELMQLAGTEDGNGRRNRAALFFLVQRGDGCCFGPADFIDPVYGQLLWQAVDSGVEVHPHLAVITPQGIDLGPELPLRPDR